MRDEGRKREPTGCRFLCASRASRGFPLLTLIPHPASLIPHPRRSADTTPGAEMSARMRGTSSTGTARRTSGIAPRSRRCPTRCRSRRAHRPSDRRAWAHNGTPGMRRRAVRSSLVPTVGIDLTSFGRRCQLASRGGTWRRNRGSERRRRLADGLVRGFPLATLLDHVRRRIPRVMDADEHQQE